MVEQAHSVREELEKQSHKHSLDCTYHTFQPSIDMRNAEIPKSHKEGDKAIHKENNHHRHSLQH